jgi:hypothetical protein
MWEPGTCNRTWNRPRMTRPLPLHVSHRCWISCGTCTAGVSPMPGASQPALKCQGELAALKCRTEACSLGVAAAVGMQQLEYAH